ncbi:tetratricopeptide repeat protein-like protein 1 [Xylogone sp. PMI_703]|nr:tetratricopeptide repeat protein-like protein 1 [Xylogone sp. PMI_703]
MSSRTERFERKPKDPNAKKDDSTKEPEEIIKFSPDEEASLLNEANELKSTANDLFGKGSLKEAIETYNKALSTCPNYLYYDLSVLHSNVAACYLKLEDWKETIKSATTSIDLLEKLEKQEDGKEKEEEQEEEADEEIISEGATKAEDTSEAGRRKADMERIKGKALMRRARARSAQGGWAALQGAEEDFKTLSQMSSLGDGEKKLVQRQLRELPPRIKAAQEKEMGEMMGKLKELGNGILRPFGLSTENFKMVKDENTGGYSMSFQQ